MSLDYKGHVREGKELMEISSVKTKMKYLISRLEDDVKEISVNME
jgi:hypothetical protein